MAEKKLDLFQLPSGLMAETGAGSTKIMGRQGPEATVRSCFPDDGPDNFRCEAPTPHLAGLSDWTKQNSALQVGGARPGIHGGLDPAGNGHRAHVATFSDQVCQHPVLLRKFEVLDGNCHNLGPA